MPAGSRKLFPCSRPRRRRRKPRAESARKEAAAAYRNLGAVAGLRDPKRALGAYEKAVALDPDDLPSLFWVGSIQIDYGDLKQAQARLERVLSLAKTDAQAFYKNWALLGLGNIKKRRGDLAGALKSCNDGLAIADRLAKSCPGNALSQRNLSVSSVMVGDVQMAQGTLTGALESYTDSLAIVDRLAKSDPANAQWQFDLGISNERIGDVQKAKGDVASALKSYEATRGIISRLAKSDPGNAHWQHDLWVSRNKIGEVLVAQGDLAGALVSHQAGLDIAEAPAPDATPPIRSGSAISRSVGT